MTNSNKSFTEKIKDTAHHAKEYVKDTLGAKTSESKYPSDSTSDKIGSKGSEMLGKTKEHLGVSPSKDESREQREGRAEVQKDWTKDSAEDTKDTAKDNLGMNEEKHSTWENIKESAGENYGKLKEKLGIRPSSDESISVTKGRAEQRWKDTKDEVKDRVDPERTT